MCIRASENTPAVESAEQSGKKGKSKTTKSEVNNVSNNSNTEGTKVAVSSKSVSSKESKADFTETPSENISETVEGKKVEGGEAQSTKVNESKTSFDKELTHQIATNSKELKTEEASPVRTTAASTPIVKTVKIAEVMNEITQIIKGQDKHTVILKIEPENLGKVKIALEMSNSSLDAKIHVESEQVKAIVENNVKQLTQSLTQNGIQLNSLTVSLSTSEQKAGRQPSFTTNKKKNSGSALDMDTEIENAEVKDINKKLGYNTYEYLA
jgi:flagellar hook-length control protein FliK